MEWIASYIPINKVGLWALPVYCFTRTKKNAIEISLIACDDVIESQSSAHTSTTFVKQKLLQNHCY